MRRKVQTKGNVNGTVKVTQLGWCAEDRIEADVQQEKEHFGRLALHTLPNPIRAVETTDDLLVVFYANDHQYLMIQWLNEPDETS